MRGRWLANVLDDPVIVEAVGETAQCLVELSDGAEAPLPEKLLLQRPEGALDAAVSLGLAEGVGMQAIQTVRSRS
jgi:hypothetical protein